MLKEEVERHSLKIETQQDRDLWIQSWSPVFHVSPVEPSSPHITDRVMLRSAGKYVFSSVDHRAQIIRRTKQQIERSGDHVCIHYCVNASSLYEFDSGTVFLGPGKIHVVDYAHPSRGIHYEGAVIGIMIPRCVLGLEPNSAMPAFSLEPDTPIGRIFYPAFQSIMTDAFVEDAEQLESRTNRLIQLLRVLLTPEQRNESQAKLLRRAQFRSILLHIDKHLADFEFTPNSIYKKFGVSRSTLYRMFLPYGGVRKYIQTRRTQQAVLDLTRAPYVRGEISKVSDRWGFSSESNFSRAVRQTFGVSPGSIAIAATPPAQTHPILQTMDAWLAQGSSCAR